LPKQLERLVKQSEELEKVYDERLRHIESMFNSTFSLCFADKVEQQSYLNQLAILLGAPFEPATPLAPIASSSNLANKGLTAPGLARIVSGTAAAARLSIGRRSDSIGSATGRPGETGDEGLYDVSEAVTGELEGRVVIALEERVSPASYLDQRLTV
jgi:hypothetical protein